MPNINAIIQVIYAGLHVVTNVSQKDVYLETTDNQYATAASPTRKCIMLLDFLPNFLSVCQSVPGEPLFSSDKVSSFHQS